MLHELIAYAEKHLTDSEPGFKTREVRWAIEIDKNGQFLNIQPLGNDRRGKLLPRCPDMHGMNAGGKSHFLVETAQTISLLFKTDTSPETISKAKARHDFYVSLLRAAVSVYPQLNAVAGSLDDEKQREAILSALKSHKAKPSHWVTWRISGHDVHLEPEAQEWWRLWRKKDLGEEAATQNPGVASTANDRKTMVCLLTGHPVKALSTHPKITRLSGVGGLAMGDAMVGFDKDAFTSYGLDQSSNAAMGAEAVQKYVDGLNDLIRRSSRKLANALVAHWYKESLPAADDPLAFLADMETDGQTEAAALAAARKLLDAIRSGARPDLANNRYYALTLSGAAGRVMVRDWMEGAFPDLVAHIERWFADLQIIARDGKGNAPDPKFMAVCGALVRELKDLPAPTAATLWKVALQGLPIPQSFLAQALVCFRSDLVADKASNHARMGLIKAYYVRLKPGGAPTMTATYNPDHPSRAYHCGALLAVLANLQRAALGDVGAGVVQRYYAASSQTPGLILGRLIANARNHLAKLDSRLAWWYEERIAQIMARLGDAAPRILDLEGQGLFALGYYQKLAELRAGKKPDTTNNNDSAADETDDTEETAP
mgnify:CR=1 FL=1